ncbi:MAG: Cof-type HAD-IIB family hydrolase [Clostridiales bacterium]|jgi:Cof subfamily protein (haloacid dehalogenase superfamily)|nr:Cof-type HAD-IIB family hydrolase [Clostridiales bacterium]
MRYKLVAMDCDGTLLSNNLEIPKKNIEVIQKLSSQGVRFIIATGRSDVTVTRYVKELGITSPVIGCNGASTRDLLNNKLYSLHPIKKSPLIKLWQYFSSNNKPAQFFNMDSYYCITQENLDEVRTILETRDGYSIRQFNSYVADSASVLTDKSIIKTIYISDDREDLLKTQKDLSNIDGIVAVRSAINCIDIVDENVSKGNALFEFMKKEGIKPEETVAIGDSENDYSMLSRVGFSITFENGDPLLKEIANYITVSNTMGGLGSALETVFEI